MVKIIGAGLAGCEAALTLANKNIKVELFEAKPTKRSPAHHMDDFCELVCSNSLKTQDIYTAHGLLKKELEILDSQILKLAKECRIPAGGALAVDRDLFAKKVTVAIKSHPNIIVTNKVVDTIDRLDNCIVATGPLTLGNLANELSLKFDGNLSFFDAAAPIVSEDSIDFNSAFIANRYGKGDELSSKDGDYVNCPLEKEEYLNFINELTKADRVLPKEFETTPIKDIPVYEGCIPVEVMASRGVDTLRFGPLKPVGFTNPHTGKRPYAVVQLRKENANGTMYNMVGFQTSLKFNEQKRIFSLIPALKNAEFLRYGVMHRNTYINAPKILNADFSLKKNPTVFIAGQLSGVEGYVESIASGLVAALYLFGKINNNKTFKFPTTTMLGALSNYITVPNSDFQPMNSNFGLLPQLQTKKENKDKKLRRKLQVDLAILDMQKFSKKIK